MSYWFTFLIAGSYPLIQVISNMADSLSMIEVLVIELIDSALEFLFVWVSH